MKYLLATAVLVAAVLAQPLQAANLPFHESQAWFCEQCTDIQSARQVAARYLAPLQCRDGGKDATAPHNDGRPRQLCDAPSRRIVLIDPNNKQVFAFVGHSEFSTAYGFDFKPVLHDQQLPAQDAAGFQQLANFYHDARKTFEQLSLQSATRSIPTDLAAVAGLPDNGQCPTETALSYYLDPNQRVWLTTSVAVAANGAGHPLYQYADSLDVGRQPRWSVAKTGFTAGALSDTAQIEMSRPPGRYVHEFTQSEIPHSVMNDYLVFDVSMPGFDSQHWPIFRLSLRLAFSRIANSYGSGGLNIQTDNPCVAKLLNRLAAQGTIELRSGGIGVSRLDDGARFVAGIPRETCLVEVYQVDKLLAQFAVPKTKISCGQQ